MSGDPQLAALDGRWGSETDTGCLGSQRASELIEGSPHLSWGVIARAGIPDSSNIETVIFGEKMILDFVMKDVTAFT